MQIEIKLKRSVSAFSKSTSKPMYWVGIKYFAFFQKIFFLVFKLKSTTSFQQYMLHCCVRLVANAVAKKESRVRRSPGTSVQKT